MEQAEADNLAHPFYCLVTRPQGLKTFHDHHPDVPVYTPMMDQWPPTATGYIVSLGRIFGTKWPGNRIEDKAGENGRIFVPSDAVVLRLSRFTMNHAGHHLCQA